MTATYNPGLSWADNLQNSPAIQEGSPVPPPMTGTWTWCGLPVDSPLGVSAGPLLDSGWLLHYARLGYNVLVYKTVRSQARDCYPLPNLVPVQVTELSEAGSTLPQAPTMDRSWAVSFGMPSQASEVWRADVAAARSHLPAGSVLVVSVVGTQDETITDPAASLQQLADDFAQCAVWAMDAGAHGVEANFSCPNVSTADGQLYQQPEAAGFVARTIRKAIGTSPLALKIGRASSQREAEALVRAVGPWVNGLAMTNSIAARVTNDDGQLMFDGSPRGICGAATLKASVSQTRLFRETVDQSEFDLDLVGVGGIFDADDVRQYLDAGASSVAMATSAMVNPHTALEIRSQF